MNGSDMQNRRTDSLESAVVIRVCAYIGNRWVIVAGLHKELLRKDLPVTTDVTLWAGGKAGVKHETPAQGQQASRPAGKMSGGAQKEQQPLLQDYESGPGERIKSNTNKEKQS